MITRLSRPHYAIRPFTFPRIYIEIRRKDLWLSGLILLAGLAIPLLMLLGVLAPGFALFFLAFALVFLGGILLLIRSGEIA